MYGGAASFFLFFVWTFHSVSVSSLFCLPYYFVVFVFSTFFFLSTFIVYVCLRLSTFVYVCLRLSTFVYVCLRLSTFVYVCLRLSTFVYVVSSFCRFVVL